MSQRQTKVGATLHGMHKHPLYRTWDGMMARCHNPKAASFHLYGARGISVCEEWKNPANFIRDVGQKPGKEYQLDRINNDGNYEPGNVRWVTVKENNRNKRKNVYVEVNGERRLLVEVSEEHKINLDTLRNRLSRGDKDLLRPLRPGQRDVEKIYMVK